MKHLIAVIKGQRPIKDIWHYFVGHYRYFFYYGGYFSRKVRCISYLRKKMIRNHIKEQIIFRIKVMNPECYNQGNCIHCGCHTTSLQMANKVCEGNCYPELMSKTDWNNYKLENNVEI